MVHINLERFIISKIWAEIDKKTSLKYLVGIRSNMHVEGLDDANISDNSESLIMFGQMLMTTKKSPFYSNKLASS